MTFYYDCLFYDITGDLMDAYVDISYIFHVLIIFTLPYFYKRILNEKMKKLELILLIIFSLLLYFNVFIFESYNYLNLLFLFVVFLFIYHKKFLKYYSLYLFVYYSNVSITMLFSNNIYLLNGIVFLGSPNAFLYIVFELVNILIIEIIMLSIKTIKLYKNYRMKVKIKLNESYINFIGYLDSGNTLLVEGVPVIFLKEEYFIKDNYKEMVVNGIGKSKCKYFKTKVFIDNKEKEVICASSKKGFKGCDCLININLMEGCNDEIIK